MISRKIAILQCNRLAGTEFFGALTDDAVDELVAAIRSARDEAIAVDVVNEWLKSKSARPTPADLYRMIQEREDPTKYWDAPWENPDPITDAERAEWNALNEKIAAANREREAKRKTRRDAFCARGATA